MSPLIEGIAKKIPGKPKQSGPICGPVAVYVSRYISLAAKLILPRGLGLLLNATLLFNNTLKN